MYPSIMLWIVGVPTLETNAGVSPESRSSLRNASRFGPEQVKPELELKLEPRLCAPRKAGDHDQGSDQICGAGCKLNCNRRSEGMADQIEPIHAGRAGHFRYLARKFLQAKRTTVIRRVSGA